MTYPPPELLPLASSQPQGVAPPLKPPFVFLISVEISHAFIVQMLLNVNTPLLIGTVRGRPDSGEEGICARVPVLHVGSKLGTNQIISTMLVIGRPAGHHVERN